MLHNFGQSSFHNRFHNRTIKTLDSIKRRIWKDKWPLVTEVELKKTGPWVLKPNQYHNHTFWPWSTGIEMLARSKFGQYKECNILFSKVASEDDHHPHIHTFYEWVNPITDKAEGAYPFRTGISAVRLAIFDILDRIKEQEESGNKNNDKSRRGNKKNKEKNDLLYQGKKYNQPPNKRSPRDEE